MSNPWFQLVCSLIAMVMIANLQYAWTLFVEPIREASQWQLSDIQFAFSLFIFLQTFVQPLDGWFIDRVGPRRFITVAGILCGLGWSAMGYATSLPQLYLFYALAGVGAAFVYSASIGSALKWFPARRGFASGVIAAGFGGGSALFNVIIQRLLIPEYGYRTAFLWTGVIQGLVITIVAQFLRHPGPGFVAPKPAAAAAATASRRNTDHFTPREMLRTAQFYVLYGMFVAVACGGLFLTANQASLARSWGMTSALTAVVFLGPLANGASRIFWGWFSDRRGRENTLVIAFLLQAACLVSVAVAGPASTVLFTITLVLVFFTWGEIYSLFPSTLGDYFGSKYATGNYGLLYTAKGVAAYLGAYLGTRVLEASGSWTIVFYATAAITLLAALTALALRSAPLPKKVAASHLASASGAAR